MTLLAVVLAWTLLSLLTVVGLGLLFAGRSRWQQWAASSAEPPAPGAQVALPLAG